MFNKVKISNGNHSNFSDRIYISGITKIMLFASLLIMLAIFLMSKLSYTFTQNALITKLKTKDLVFTITSIAEKIDGRIERAKETSMVLSEDPMIIKWVSEGENDELLGDFTKQKITDIARSYDYDNSFVVSTITNHYWAEDGQLIDTVSEDDPYDSWFFTTIRSGNPVSVVLDYNKERNDTFVFIDALMGDVHNPIAVVGVGLSLKEISEEFKSYKFGEKSSMWLIDDSGRIFISENIEQAGSSIDSFLPKDIGARIVSGGDSQNNKTNVLEYTSGDGEIYDLIYHPIESTDWKLILQIPRSESVAIIQLLKTNIMIASIIAFIVLISIFFVISRLIVNPFKQTVLLKQELERVVNERTLEIKEMNTKILDSIEYAKLIQETILPAAEEMHKMFKDYFVIWKPRDIVGGDFYWIKKFHHCNLIVVGDCTGHGVSGALMTMAVNSILNYIIDENCCTDPALILQKLNYSIKTTLNAKVTNRMAESGLDIGVLSITNNHGIFAGAKISLYINSCGEIIRIKGNNKSIGYESTDEKYEFMNHDLTIKENDSFYLTTDGYLDQNGGVKDYSFGRKRFEEIIKNNFHKSLDEQKQKFEDELGKYMNHETQRDDITIVGLKMKL